MHFVLIIVIPTMLHSFTMLFTTKPTTGHVVWSIWRVCVDFQILNLYFYCILKFYQLFSSLMLKNTWDFRAWYPPICVFPADINVIQFDLPAMSLESHCIMHELGAILWIYEDVLFELDVSLHLICMLSIFAMPFCL